jgi:hypothetical protein
MGHTGVLDGAVEVEVAAEAALATTTVDDADADAEAEACPVAVDPVARVAGGVVVVVVVVVFVPGVFSFCARFVALPNPRNLPIIPPPGVPGVATPFPLAPLLFPVAVPLLLPAPVFAPAPDSLSSGVAGEAAVAVAPGPPLDTDGRRVGTGASSFCATTFDVAAVLAVVVPPLGAPWTGCEA